MCQTHTHTHTDLRDSEKDVMEEYPPIKEVFLIISPRLCVLYNKAPIKRRNDDTKQKKYSRTALDLFKLDIHHLLLRGHHWSHSWIFFQTNRKDCRFCLSENNACYPKTRFRNVFYLWPCNKRRLPANLFRYLFCSFLVIVKHIGQRWNENLSSPSSCQCSLSTS